VTGLSQTRLDARLCYALHLSALTCRYLNSYTHRKKLFRNTYDSDNTVFSPQGIKSSTHSKSSSRVRQQSVCTQRCSLFSKGVLCHDRSSSDASSHSFDSHVHCPALKRGARLVPAKDVLDRRPRRHFDRRPNRMRLYSAPSYYISHIKSHPQTQTTSSHNSATLWASTLWHPRWSSTGPSP
jgi:hypothetical protein